MRTQEVVNVIGQFPGFDFEAKVRGAAAAEVDAAERLQTAKKKIQTVEQNRAILELDDRDPEAELRVLRADARNAESQIQIIRQATQRIFLEERQRHDDAKNVLWAAINSEIITPHVAALRELSTKLAAAINDVIVLTTSSEDVAAASPLHTAISTFDSGTVAYNALAREFKMSAQAFVPENEFLAVHIGETMARNIRQNLNFRELEKMMAIASSPQLAREFVKTTSRGQ